MAYFFCEAAGLLCAMNSGAMTARGSSRWGAANHLLAVFNGGGLNGDGTGSGEGGLRGGGGNDTLDLIGAADGAWGVAGFGVIAGPDEGRCLGAIAGAGAADVLAGAALMRTALNGSPFGPKMPPTSSGTSTFFCTVRRGNCSGLS